jgi:hypothetical protein
MRVLRTAKIREKKTQAGGHVEYDSPLDSGIRRYVEVLNEEGVETFESCEGGEGHAYPRPTIRFHGDRSEGFRAVAVALQNALPVGDLRRTWPIIDGEPTGPYWEMTFSRRADVLRTAPESDMIDPARIHAAQSRIRECIDRGLPPSPADLQICLASQDAPTLDTLLMAAMARNGHLEAELAVLRTALRAARTVLEAARDRLGPGDPVYGGVAAIVAEIDRTALRAAQKEERNERH